MISDSDVTTGDGPPDDSHDAEWAWFADAYRQVPAPRPEAIAHAVQAVQASATAWHIVRVVLRWLLGTTAVGLAVGGYAVVRSGRVTPADTQPSPADTVALPPASRAPTAAIRPSRPEPVMPPPSTPMPVPVPVPHRTSEPTSEPALAPTPGPTPEHVPADTSSKIPEAPDETPMPSDSTAIPGVSEADRERLHEALGPTAGDQFMTGVHLLKYGVTTWQIVEMERRIASEGRTRDVVHAVLGLVEHGVPGATAAGAILHSFDSGIPDTALITLRDEVVGDIAHGERPLDAFNARLAKVYRDFATPASDSTAQPSPTPHAP